MTVPFIDSTAEPLLDWIELTEALAAGHQMPKAEIGDTFLYRDPDTLLSRSAWIDGMGVAVKSATIFPGNANHGQSTINGSVSLFGDGDGVLQALVDFHLVTKWKTAGDSLLAARRLARPDTARILIVGAGTVGASLLQAFGAGFPDAALHIWNRSRDKAETLAVAHGDVTVEDNLPAAVEAADIIVSATMTTEPILQGDWFRPGQHVNLIGAYRPDMREVDDRALQRAEVYVDSFDTTVDHIGELKTPLSTGAIHRSDLIADFYQLDQFAPWSPDTITLFKNGGGAHLDLMTSQYILSKWKAAQA